MNGSAIENYVNGFFIVTFSFFIFQRFIVKFVGVLGVVSPYLASYVLNLILHSTHNSDNGGKKNTLVINSFILNIKPHHA
jgi:hypothetical protein